MKFRIIRYYDRFMAQVFNKKTGEYCTIESPTGYPTAQDAKNACIMYKTHYDSKIVEEFEL